MTHHFYRKYSSEPCMTSKMIGNGYGHFLDLDNMESNTYKPCKKPVNKIKIRLPKKLHTSSDENSGDLDKNHRKKMMFIGVLYIATVSLVVIEYFVFRYWT